MKKRIEKKAKPAPAGSGITGTYIYDRELGKIVKISDRVPSVAAKVRKTAAKSLPCSDGGCSGGACPAKGDFGCCG
ncbi:MAG: hypothetical protein A2X36_07965 [Elusimicrobia bacterium GWA2_69_24]|nr:MAG: hypothetical protein A2X36_07965 [Elusimicrobia bacterium GWA2_69_24]HBL16549.1 hypothetical protein [Elusimicrobiota bacterium]